MRSFVPQYPISKVGGDNIPSFLHCSKGDLLNVWELLDVVVMRATEKKLINLLIIN